MNSIKAAIPRKLKERLIAPPAAGTLQTVRGDDRHLLFERKPLRMVKNNYFSNIFRKPLDKDHLKWYNETKSNGFNKFEQLIMVVKEMRTWLQEKRKKAGLTQRELAERIGMSQQWCSFVEAKDGTVLVPLAKKLAKELGFDWQRFYEED